MRKSELLKGSTEMVLLSILKNRDMYGYEIIEELKRISDGYLLFKEGMLYPALKKLEEKELVKSYWRDSLEGPSRKYYYITKNGVRELKEQITEWELFHEIINKVVHHQK
ncbi:transcriptional regulator, PadR family [Bacillus sp. OV322]|uniref:PadR family transcriptional regulator n=1 Tax=Bacillus sp. OV322 TaxID=1882764 RepID=UPI0008F2CA94|nr:PadR family transcriptional regulator [Bacillus sp. OV322]SFC64019.1 transcriptional regulator, PadR family [Bacillus sp. OV322]